MQNSGVTRRFLTVLIFPAARYLHDINEEYLNSESQFDNHKTLTRDTHFSFQAFSISSKFLNPGSFGQTLCDDQVPTELGCPSHPLSWFIEAINHMACSLFPRVDQISSKKGKFFPYALRICPHKGRPPKGGQI